MLPDFLKKYEAELEKYRLESVSITAKPNRATKNLPIKTSKLLGLPYLPLTMNYPHNKFGKPMVMIAQINFEEMPRLKHFPRKGIFQVFTSPMFWDIGNEYYIYLYHKDINLPYYKRFPSFKDELYDSLPINCEHSLTFSKDIQYGSRYDYRFDFKFDGKTLDDFSNELGNVELNELENLFHASGHRIGGYAFFTQGDPRENDPTRDRDVLLLQIDTDREIMFGDAGVSNIFINIEDLNNRRFDKAYFNWDCA